MNFLTRFLPCALSKVLLWGILYGVLSAMHASSTLFYVFYAYVAISAYKLFAYYQHHESAEHKQHHSK